MERSLSAETCLLRCHDGGTLYKCCWGTIKALRAGGSGRTLSPDPGGLGAMRRRRGRAELRTGGR